MPPEDDGALLTGDEGRRPDVIGNDEAKIGLPADDSKTNREYAPDDDRLDRS
jgi:hypothetical protein